MSKEEEQNQEQVYIPVVNQIAQGLSCYTEEDFTNLTIQEAGEELEDILTTVCYLLGEAGALTETKVDVEFCLSLVATYLLAKKQGSLDGTEPTPADLFKTNIFERLADVKLNAISDGDAEETTEEVPREDSQRA